MVSFVLFSKSKDPSLNSRSAPKPRVNDGLKMRASVRMTRYLESWGAVKPFAHLQSREGFTADTIVNGKPCCKVSLRPCCWRFPAALTLCVLNIVPCCLLPGHPSAANNLQDPWEVRTTELFNRITFLTPDSLLFLRCVYVAAEPGNAACITALLLPVAAAQRRVFPINFPSQDLLHLFIESAWVTASSHFIDNIPLDCSGSKQTQGYVIIWLLAITLPELSYTQRDYY